MQDGASQVQLILPLKGKKFNEIPQSVISACIEGSEFNVF
jgi:hypothetical protein